MVDYCIIGGGVVGCAIARELSRYEASVILVEAGGDVCTMASGANSAIIHAGYDAPAGSKKAYYNVLGSKLYKTYAKILDVPYRQTGSLVIALSADEEVELRALYEQGIANGVDVKLLHRNQVLALEPNLVDGVRQALYAPAAAIIDPFELCYALRENAEANGVQFKLNFEVHVIDKGENCFTIKSANESVCAKYIINCAGNYGGRIARICGDNIILAHRLGEYLYLDKSTIVNRPIFRVPTNKGKGALVSPTVHGNIFVGPTAIDVATVTTSVRREAFAELKQAGNAMVSNIEWSSMIRSASGLRAISHSGDFIIGWSERCENLYNVLGICSPGLSCIPAIASKVVASFKLKQKTNFKPSRKRIKRLVNCIDKKRLVASDSRYGNIVCRCENVTEAEVVEAIARGASTVDGIKRRLRAGMGRCQGGFCKPNIIKILAREKGLAQEDVNKSSVCSNCLVGEEL